MIDWELNFYLGRRRFFAVLWRAELYIPGTPGVDVRSATMVGMVCDEGSIVLAMRRQLEA